MNKIDFNLHCAWILLENDEVASGRVIEIMLDAARTGTYNPYEDLNELVGVVEIRARCLNENLLLSITKNWHETLVDFIVKHRNESINNKPDEEEICQSSHS